MCPSRVCQSVSVGGWALWRRTGDCKREKLRAVPAALQAARRRTCDARREEVLAGVAVPVAQQRPANGVEVVCKARGFPKRGALVEAAIEQARLAAEELDHLADGHAAGEAVRVHDEVGRDAALRKGQVLLRRGAC